LNLEKKVSEINFNETHASSIVKDIPAFYVVVLFTTLESFKVQSAVFTFELENVFSLKLLMKKILFEDRGFIEKHTSLKTCPALELSSLLSCCINYSMHVSHLKWKMFSICNFDKNDLN
jgi:hypothetical protein